MAAPTAELGRVRNVCLLPIGAGYYGACKALGSLLKPPAMTTGRKCRSAASLGVGAGLRAG